MPERRCERWRARRWRVGGGAYVARGEHARGVDIDDVSFRAPDVPTVANVAVAPRARRYGAGRAIVDAVAERLKTDASWRAWREFVSDEDDYLYARVVDERALPFWSGVGFERVPVEPGARDARGLAGTWFRRKLSSF